MTIFLKNKHTLKFNEFKFRCCIGKNGLTRAKKEGDKKTPKGTFEIGQLFFREDKVKIPKTKLKCIILKKDFGWCDDLDDEKNYNKLVSRKVIKKSEKLFRNDYKYDLLIPIKYNTPKTILGKGSAIFLHLTKNYKPTAGCIAISKKDFLILLRLVKKKTKITIS